MTEDRIDKTRRQIDRVDEDILRLLNERMRLVEEIGRVKQARDLAINDPGREREIIGRLSESNAGPISGESLEAIYREIFSAAKNLEKSSIVAYLGPEATFTHLATLKHFGRSQSMVSLKSIREVFRAVEKDEFEQGVVPIENSTEGVVNHTLDMLLDSPLSVVDEIYLEVHHHLLSVEDDLGSIKLIFSHPQAIAQCQEWLADKAPGVSIVEVPSTAEAARRALETEGSGAIASELAARLYHLKVIARRIEDRFDNLTRFLVIGKSTPGTTGRDKTSILFSIKDRVGALNNILKPISEAGINLTKIESRPSRRKAWDYVFFVDIEGHRLDGKIQQILAELKNHCPFFKILGSYPQRERSISENG